MCVYAHINWSGFACTKKNKNYVSDLLMLYVFIYIVCAFIYISAVLRILEFVARFGLLFYSHVATCNHL